MTLQEIIDQILSQRGDTNTALELTAMTVRLAESWMPKFIGTDLSPKQAVHLAFCHADAFMAEVERRRKLICPCEECIARRAADAANN